MEITTMSTATHRFECGALATPGTALSAVLGIDVSAVRPRVAVAPQGAVAGATRAVPAPGEALV